MARLQVQTHKRFCLHILHNGRLNYVSKWHSSQPLKEDRKISNFRAHLMITSLIKKQKNAAAMTEQQRRNIIKDVFAICDQINEMKDQFVVSALLKLCLDYRYASKMLTFWKDIEHMQQNGNKTVINTFPLLMKCCIECQDMSKCIQVLSWIQKHNYKLKLRDIFIIKLINNPHATLSNLKFIHHLINHHNIQNDGKYYQTALINAYAKQGSIHDAKQVFLDMDDDKKDIVAICAMMTVYINNRYYAEAVQLYDDIDSHIQLDTVSHALVIKACVQIGAVAKDKVNDIYRTIQLQYTNIPIALKTTLIDFYGTHEAFELAQEIYDSIDDREKDVVCIGAMMKTYMNNQRNKDALCLYDAMDGVYGLQKDVVCIGAMMKTYMNNQRNKDALCLYDAMDGVYGLQKDEVCHCLAMKACSNSMIKEKGEYIHAVIERNRYCNMQTMNTLIDFYGHCGEIDKAWKVFQSIDAGKKDTICINAMMNVYLMNKMDRECVELFQQFDCHIPD
eukprot:611530_1